MGSRLNISTFSYIQKAYQEGIYADTPFQSKAWKGWHDI